MRRHRTFNQVRQIEKISLASLTLKPHLKDLGEGKKAIDYLGGLGLENFWNQFWRSSRQLLHTCTHIVGDLGSMLPQFLFEIKVLWDNLWRIIDTHKSSGRVSGSLPARGNFLKLRLAEFAG